MWTFAGSQESWPIVITTKKASILQSRQSLYEAILWREQEGAVLVERQLQGVDLCLDRTTCLTIWTQQAMQVHC